MIFLKVFLAAILAVSATSVNAALVPNGSFSGAQFGTVSVNSNGTWGIGTGTTSITIPQDPVVSSLQDPYDGATNNLYSGNGGTVSLGDQMQLSDLTFIVTAGTTNINLTLTLDSYTFIFTSETVTSQVNGNIGLYFLGMMTGDTTGNLATGYPASFSATFTQSAPTGSIGAAYSLDIPPAPQSTVPEPSTWIILAIGLIGFSLNRRFFNADSH